MNITTKQKLKKYLPPVLLIGFALAFIMLFFKISVWTPKRKVPSYRVSGYGSAPVKIEIFTDLQCPACAWAHSNLSKLRQKYPEKTLLTFKHFPLTGHRWAFDAAVFSECAGKQDMFFEYAGELFIHQENWSGLKDATPYFISIAENMGLDMDAFYKCTSNPETAKIIETDFDEAVKRKVRFTPAFFMKGNKILGFEGFRKKFMGEIKKYETE